jgi:hypothetical protein
MTIEVTIETNPFQVTNDIQNFKVIKKDWDLGDPLGYGSTLEKALEDFIGWAELKYDEEVELTIIEK